MEFRILGPLEVWDRGAMLPVRGARQRALLAILLVHANEVVGSDRLIEELWGDAPPQSAGAALRVRVSHLRRALASSGGPAPLHTRPPGYIVSVEPDQLDAERFERLLAEGRRQLGGGSAARAASTLANALALWRGPPLDDFTYEPFAQAEIARLEELQITALEERIDADLVLGRHELLIGELESLIARHRLRERLRGQLMLALYRAGRQADALEAYRQTRRLLVDELGIEPSPPLQRLEKAILVQDAALERLERTPEPATPSVAARAERPTRKLVTVLASDLPGDEQTERLRNAASAILMRHGGSVERSIGGSIVAVFGVAAAREDDSSRAVRAALVLRDHAAQSTRTGIATGELVVGDPGAGLASAEGPLAAAADLRSVAASGEILIDEVTRQLVSDIVHVEASTQEASWRVVELVAEQPLRTRPGEAPLVGRDFELAQLRAALARAIRAETPSVFTVLGYAGIGKSRLAREFIGDLGEQAGSLVGRCIPYGESLTFRPLHDIIAQAADGVSRQAVRGLLAEDPDAEAIASLVAAAVGGDEAAGPADETFWAVRRLLEALAAIHPLVVVVEDLQWATATFLDLVEHLADWMEAPVLLLCLARPELLERRPSWGGGKANATALTLEPLDPEETERLVKSLPRGAVMSGEARARIASAAGGNPLFAEQLTVSWADTATPTTEISVPPTIQSLLAARLDRLGPGERAAIERAAVIGTGFSLEGVLELLPQEARAVARRHLDALVRKRFVRRRSSSASRDGDFRFAHALVRDAAYRAITVDLRAELHERYADWLLRTSTDRNIEEAEVIGYHLEEAHRHRAQFAPVDDAHSRRLATRAAEHLSAAAQRALAREDMPGAAALFRRARALLADQNAARDALAPAFARALIEGAEFTEADGVLGEALASAAASGDRWLRAHVLLARVELGIPTAVDVAELQEQAEEAAAELARLGDDRALARTLWSLAKLHARRGRSMSRRETLERALPHARGAHDVELEADILHHLWWSVAAGPDPVELGQPYLEELQRIADDTGSPFRQSDVLAPRAYLCAIKGDFEASRDLVERAAACLVGLGLPGVILVGHLKGLIELLAGDSWEAERAARPAYERAQVLGYREGVVDNAMTLAEALYAQGRHEEARQTAEVASDNAAPGHVHPQILWRRIRAKVSAHLRHIDEAVMLVHEAQQLAEQMDDVRWQAATLLDVAEVLLLAGAQDEAASATETALRLYERKGDDVSALKARRLLAERRRSPRTQDP